VNTALEQGSEDLGEPGDQDHLVETAEERKPKDDTVPETPALWAPPDPTGKGKNGKPDTRGKDQEVAIDERGDGHENLGGKAVGLHDRIFLSP
jgi:hypothetical protein